jgi:hypothetical protein
MPCGPRCRCFAAEPVTRLGHSRHRYRGVLRFVVRSAFYWEFGTMKPIYGLHKDAAGAVLNAGSFDYSYKLNDWLRALDVRAGDTITFGEVAVREDEAAPTLEAVA